jgi:hypothetical protein
MWLLIEVHFLVGVTFGAEVLLDHLAVTACIGGENCDVLDHDDPQVSFIF